MLKKLLTKRISIPLLLGLILVLAFSQMAFAAEEESDWAAMYEEEWRAMGLDEAPALMPPPAGQQFEYALITPATKDVPDSEAFVIVLMGDGFTEEDMAKWHYYCQYYARNLTKYVPFNEFEDIIKMYRIDVISEDSGVTRSDSPDGRNMSDDPKNTFFGGYLWSQNMARLGGANTRLGIELANAYVPDNLNAGKTMFLNTSVYGGSGGTLVYATLHWAFLDVAIHEMTHSSALLPDEYLYSGTAQVTSAKENMYNEFNTVHRDWIDDPEWQEWSPWVRFLGKDGITFDPWLEGLSTSPDYGNMFRPSCDCKMRYVGANLVWEQTGKDEFPFCALCLEKWRDRLCIMSNAPVLHFQPYNDQFYDSEPVTLDNKHFIVRLPEESGKADLCVRTYGEQVGTEPVNGLSGSLKMTVYDKFGKALYSNVPVDTPLDLKAGTYRVEASFSGSYLGTKYDLELRSQENTFQVKPQTIITRVGKYAEPWNSEDKMDTLSRPWIEDTPVTLPELGIDVSRVGGTNQSQFEISYSWHVRNFDGSAGTQLGETGIYPDQPADGPSAVGQYILAVHSKAKAGAPAALADYNVTNEFPFEIETPYHTADHYPVNGGVYSHELVSNDFRGITILGEGFTEEEQDEFEAAAEAFITKFLDTDPVKRVSERFCFFIENSMSASSGITKENGEQKDTYYGFQLNEDGSIGTYRTDSPMDVILFQEVWRRDTNMKTWAQWGATVVLLNEDEEQANLNWRHPESNRSVHLSTIADADYSRLVESLVTQFAHVRSNRDEDLLDTYRWMEGPEQNASFEETMERLIESCYSHEMYGRGVLNLPRPVIVSDAATKLYITDGETVLNWDVPESFKAYSYGHELQINTTEADTFTIRYYTDNGHRVGELLPEAPVAPGAYWAEADLPTGPKFYLNTETDRYGFTYEAGQPLQGRNGEGTSDSARVRGFVRFEIAQELELKFHSNNGRDEFVTMQALSGQPYGQLPNQPFHRGYKFLGWNTEKDGSGEMISEESLVSLDTLDLYATWRERSTGGTGAIAADEKEEADVPSPERELPFLDVNPTDWFYADVLQAWKDGLINGMTATSFEPNGQLSLAQAIKLAAVMHQSSTGTKILLANGSPMWYSSYVDYAIANGIIKEGQFTDYERAATRREFAAIFAAALPADKYAAINEIADGRIPDVKEADLYGAEIYKLYRAGILSGNDAAGTFAPESNIKRSEVSAIVNRMMHAEARKSLKL